MGSARTDVINYEQLRHYNKSRRNRHHSDDGSGDDVTRAIESLLVKTAAKRRPETGGCERTSSPTRQHRRLYENRKRHDIRLYVAGIHAGCDVTAADDVDVDSLPVSRRDRVAQLEALLRRKSLFRRSDAERGEIAEVVKRLWPAELRASVGADIVEQLSWTAVTELYPHRGMSIDGSGGLFMVLTGAVRTRSRRYLPHAGNATTPTDDGVQLGAGDWFGTLAPADRSSSSLTCVVTSAECHVLRIYPNDYERVLARLKRRKLNEKLSAVRACPSYRKWPPHVLAALANRMRWRHFRDGEVVLGQGKTPDEMVVVRSGTVDVVRMLPVYVDGRRFRAVRIGRLVAGDTFAEDALVNGTRLPVELIARGKCQIGVVSARHVPELSLTARTLLGQLPSNYNHVTADDVRELLVRQHKDEEWRKAKHSVSTAWAHDYAVVNGEGKWKDAKM